MWIDSVLDVIKTFGRSGWYMDFSDWVKMKKNINFWNENKKLFKWAITVALNHLLNHPERACYITTFTEKWFVRH